MNPNLFSVVLVEPQDSLNIGAVARAMRNLGFSDLSLVAPCGYNRERAAVTACWATPLLDSLQIYKTFPEAIADAEDVVGFSGREGKTPPHFVLLPQWSNELTQTLPRKTALVFGPEDNGLRQEHLNYCRRVIRIPSTTECPSLNLAQSVLVVLYELTRVFPNPALLPLAPPQQTRPTGNDYAQLDRLLEAVMQESGFWRDGTPEPVPGVVKNLFRRLEMSPQEMGILLGLVGRIHTTLKRDSKAT